MFSNLLRKRRPVERIVEWGGADCGSPPHAASPCLSRRLPVSNVQESMSSVTNSSFAHLSLTGDRSRTAQGDEI